MLRCCKSEHFQERDPSCLWVAFATSWSQPYDAEAPVEPYNPIHWILSNYIPGQSWRGSCLFSPEFISESFGRPRVKGLSTFLVPLMWNMWSQSNVETVIAHWLLFVMFIEAERVDEKIVSWRILVTVELRRQPGMSPPELDRFEMDEAIFNLFVFQWFWFIFSGREVATLVNGLHTQPLTGLKANCAP